MIYLDTHVVAWLFAGKKELIPQMVQDELNRQELLISPVVMLELEYLYEVGRTTERGLIVVEDLATRIGLKSCDLPFDTVVKQSLNQNWTRDPFDRLIVAQASVRNTRLITKDTIIRKHYPHTIW